MAEDRNDSDQVVGAPNDNTSLLAVLDDLKTAGFDVDFRPVGDEGFVRCPACGEASPVNTFRDVVERRLEGASDPADMVLVVAGHCPKCGAGGAVVLGYGPDASESDAAVVVRLP